MSKPSPLLYHTPWMLLYPYALLHALPGPLVPIFHLEENFQFFCCNNKWQQEVGFSKLDYCIPGPVGAFDEKQASNQLPVNGHICA